MFLSKNKLPRLLLLLPHFNSETNKQESKQVLQKQNPQLYKLQRISGCGATNLRCNIYNTTSTDIIMTTYPVIERQCVGWDNLKMER